MNLRVPLEHTYLWGMLNRRFRGDPVGNLAYSKYSYNLICSSMKHQARSKVLNGTTIWQAQLEMVSDSSCCKHPNFQWSIVHLIVYLILLRTLYIYRSIDRYVAEFPIKLSAIMHHLKVVDFHNMALHTLPKRRVFRRKTLQNTHTFRTWNVFPGVSGASLTSSTWQRRLVPSNPIPSMVMVYLPTFSICYH